MLAVIRVRGKIGVPKDIRDTLDMLGLKRINTLSILQDNESTRGMIKKVESHVTWGEISEELLKELESSIKSSNKSSNKSFNLNPPRGGYKSIKKKYPKGDLGYRGSAINDLIKRMKSD